MLKRLLCVILLFAGAAAPAVAAEEVGKVSRIAGRCTGTFAGASEPLALAASIYQEHRLATGPEARLEVTFEDESLLTLGENAELTVDRFVYDPGRRSRILLAVAGAMRFILPPRRTQDAEITVRTPVAALGARGTDFWSGPIDGQYGILLLEGEVVVSSPAGQVVLDEPGEGVNFAAPGAAPSAVTIWPQQKVERALAAVAFP